jgi:phosphatidylserine/phosphatidylglycerophosphate/cardiolipin synthase-like enzyme
LNAECNVLVFDDACAAALEGSFRAGLENSREITMDEWRERTWSHRLLDTTARALRWAL